MKMGMIISKGTEKEVRQEYNTLIEKAIKGFADAVEVKENEFVINSIDMKITFIFDTCLSEYGIYQIIN